MTDFKNSLIFSCLVIFGIVMGEGRGVIDEGVVARGVVGEGWGVVNVGVTTPGCVVIVGVVTGCVVREGVVGGGVVSVVAMFSTKGVATVGVVGW